MSSKNIYDPQPSPSRRPPIKVSPQTPLVTIPPYQTPPRPRSPSESPSTPPRIPSPVTHHLPRRLSTVTEQTEFSTPPSRPLSPLFAADSEQPTIINIVQSQPGRSWSPPPSTSRRRSRRRSRSRSRSRSPQRVPQIITISSPPPPPLPGPVIIPGPPSSRSSSSSPRRARRRRSYSPQPAIIVPPPALPPPFVIPPDRRSRSRSRSRSSSRSPRRRRSYSPPVFVVPQAPQALPPPILLPPDRRRSRSSSRSPRRRRSYSPPPIIIPQAPPSRPPPIIIQSDRRRSRSRSRSRSPIHHRRRRSRSRSSSRSRSPPVIIPPQPVPPSRRVRYASQIETPIPIPPYYSPLRQQPTTIVIQPPESRRRTSSRHRSPPRSHSSSRRPSRSSVTGSQPYVYGAPPQYIQPPSQFIPGAPQILPVSQPYPPYYPQLQGVVQPGPPIIPAPYIAPPTTSSSSSDTPETEDEHRSAAQSWRDPSTPIPDSPYISQVIGEDEWQKFVHPNGSLYWSSSDKAVVSDQQPDGGTILHVGPQLQSIRIEIDAYQWEIYVSAGSPHFVHHASRSVSEPSEAFHLFKARIAQGYSDIVTRLDLEYHYWTYVQGHPNHVNLPSEAKYDAEEAILWSHADRSLFDSSNAPFEKEVAKEMLAVIKQLDGLPRETLMVWFVGAVLRVVVEERKACHYGTPQARQFRHMEKADDVPELPGFTSLRKELAWRMVAALTLGAPLSYMKRIINVDRSNGISTSRWRAFLRNLCAEWVDTNLLSTVLVSATTAMLTVPGLNPLAQITAFFSILSSLSSVMCGMLLIFTHRGRMESTGRAAYLYFDYAKRMTGSPHSLAVLLSLPLVLTLWSIFWFVLSVASLAFKPGIPLTPPVWAHWLRYGTLSLVGSLVLIVLTVGWFFRNRRENSYGNVLPPLQMPPPPYPFHFPPPVFLPGPPPHGPFTFDSGYRPTPVVGAVYHPPGPAPTREHHRSSSSRRRRHSSRSSAIAAATFRPRSI